MRYQQTVLQILIIIFANTWTVLFYDHRIHEMSQLSALETLDLSDNKVGTQLWNLPERLKWLSLRGCQAKLNEFW